MDLKPGQVQYVDNWHVVNKTALKIVCTLQHSGDVCATFIIDMKRCKAVVQQKGKITVYLEGTTEFVFAAKYSLNKEEASHMLHRLFDDMMCCMCA